jgi:hypothetical protein
VTPTQGLIVALIAAFGPFATAILATISWRQNKRRQESEIGLTDTQKMQLMQDINESRAQEQQARTTEKIAQERWWAEQFGIVRAELARELESSDSLRRELDRVKSFMRNEHRAWDDLARSQIQALGGSIDEPPLLEAK